MTRRKPPGVSFETWVERQIREAEERGELRDLPGAGRPLADLDEPHDELWWVRRKLRREGLSYLPPSLVLRKEAEDALMAADRARSEGEVRTIIAAINEKIRRANRLPIEGPPHNLVPYDVERIVARWRDQHGERADEHQIPRGPGGDGLRSDRPRRRSSRWLRRPGEAGGT